MPICHKFQDLNSKNHNIWTVAMTRRANITVVKNNQQQLNSNKTNALSTYDKYSLVEPQPQQQQRMMMVIMECRIVWWFAIHILFLKFQ